MLSLAEAKLICILKSFKQKDLFSFYLPVSLQLTHVFDNGRPVESPRFLLQPSLHLLPVLVSVIGGYDLPEGLAGREELVDGWAGANVDQGISLDAICSPSNQMQNF